MTVRLRQILERRVAGLSEVAIARELGLEEARVRAILEAVGGEDCRAALAASRKAGSRYRGLPLAPPPDRGEH